MKNLLISILSFFISFLTEKTTNEVNEEIIVQKKMTQLKFNFSYSEEHGQEEIRVKIRRKIKNKTSCVQLEFSFDYTIENSNKEVCKKEKFSIVVLYKKIMNSIISNTKKIYNKFNNACKEVKAIQKGKLPITTLRDIIDELEKSK